LSPFSVPPSSSRDSRHAFVGRAESLPGPRGLPALPWVPSRGGGVNDDRPRRAGFRGTLVFVIPSPVPEPGLPREEIWIPVGIVVHHQEHFAFEVRSLVVVPLVLGRDDSVADENDLGIFQSTLRVLLASGGNEVL